MKIVAKKIFLVFLFISFYFLDATDIGSNFTIQSHIVFDFNEDNRIANDAVMENSFTLTNKEGTSIVATCSFDSYFPIQGLTNLNGGYLNLNNNVMFKNISALGSAGKVYGNGFSITFPATENIVGVPSSVDRGGRIERLSQIYSTGNVYSVDWSYDDNYLVDNRTVSANTEVNIYSFINENLTWRVGGELISAGLDVRWHPSLYYLAESRNQTLDSLLIYEYIPLATLTNTTYDHMGEGSIGASVSWSPNGQYLAASTSTANNKLRVYSFLAGDITLIDQEYYADGNGSRSGLDWNLDGDKIALATDMGNLLIYNFDGTSLSISTSIHIAGSTSANGVSWKKDRYNKDLIAVALASSPDNIRVYSYEDDALTQIAAFSDNIGYTSVDWDDNGNRILAGRYGSATEDEIRVFYFNQNTNDLFLIDSYNLQTDVGANCVMFDHNGKYFASGDNYQKTNAYNFNQNSMFIDNTNLVFNSDAEFIVTTTFSGLCTINGNGNKVYLNEDGSLNIASGSQLKLQNLELVGLRQNNLQCLADDAEVIFEDCILTITSNYVFDTGSILFKGDVVISGTSKFTYSASCSSTIDSYSTLKVSSDSTFSYAPSISKRDLIYMNDNTSLLYLDGCTLHSTTTGLRLTRGKLFIENLVTLDADGSVLSESICFGDGIASGDLDVQLLAHANLDVYGMLEYKNTD